MRALKPWHFYVSWFLVLVATACIDDFAGDTHPCDTCLPCEECIEGSDGAYCYAEEHIYQGCGEDGNVHWFDLCEAEEDLIDGCVNAECVSISDFEAVCECTENWQGDDCDFCPGNWDEDKDCAFCQGLWIDEDNQCGTCPDNVDITQDCSVCLGNWDPVYDCEVCIGADEPEILECGNGLIQDGEECDDCDDVDWDGCNSCQIHEILVHSSQGFDYPKPKVQMGPDGGFTVVWSDNARIFVQRHKENGTPIAGATQVNEGEDTAFSVENKDLAVGDSGDFVVVWTESFASTDTDIYARKYGSDGLPLGDEFAVNTQSTSNMHPLAVDMAANGSFVVVWNHSAGLDDDAGIRARQYNSDGLPMGGEFKVTSPSDSGLQGQVYPSVAMADGGEFIITWTRYEQTHGHAVEGVFGRVYGADGSPSSDEFRIDAGASSYLRVSYTSMEADGSFSVAWYNTDFSGIAQSISARNFYADGQPESSPFVLTYSPPSGSARPDISMNKGQHLVVTTKTATRLYYNRYDGNGGLVGGENSIGTYQLGGSVWDSPPSVDVRKDGRFVCTWGGLGTDVIVMVQRFDMDANPLGSLPWDHYQ